MPNMLDVGKGMAMGMAAPNEESPLDQTMAQFDKLMEMKALLQKVSGGLGLLTKMGDTVSQEDVIEEAGKLVAAGLTPKGMATLLSEMPEKPEAIAQWIGAHAQNVAEKSGQLDQALQVVQHQMGVQAAAQLKGMPQLPTQPQAQLDTTGMEGPLPAEAEAQPAAQNALAPAQ